MESSRREFLRNAAAIGAGVGFLTLGNTAIRDIIKGPFRAIPYANAAPMSPTDTGDSLKVVHSLCMGCNARCGIRARVYGGVVYKVDGSPYNMANNFWDGLDINTPLAESFKHSGKMCSKGQSISHAAYDPYRVVAPLKRVGKRGEGKFEPISWKQLIDEVTNGTTINGEKITGFKAYYDAYVSVEEVADAVVKNVSKDFLNKWSHEVAHGKETGDMTKFVVEYIKKLWLPPEEAAKLPKEISSKLIDPTKVGLGPKSNLALTVGGRVTEGRGEFIERFLYNTIGSQNFIGHADVCQWPKWAGQIFAYDRPHVGPDVKKARYLIAWGAQIGEAFNPAVPTWSIMGERRAVDGLKVVFIDPRAHNGVNAYSHRHIMPKPGEDGAIASAMISWAIANKAYNEKYLSAPNLEAAKKLGEQTFTNATHLVVTAPKSSPLYRKMLRASDVGLGTADEYVVVDENGSLKNSAKVASATLFVDGHGWAKTIDNDMLTDEDRDIKNNYPTQTKGLKISTKSGEVQVTTSLQLLKDMTGYKSVDEWCKLAQVNVKDITKTAEEFFSYGKEACIVSYRGAVMHMNGAYNAWLIESLNMLNGNLGHQGGMIWKVGAGKTNDGAYKLEGDGRKPWGLKLVRTTVNYEETLFYYEKKMKGENPFPAVMPWFKFTGPKYHCSGLYPSMNKNYPYDLGTTDLPYALINYVSNPLYSYPGQLKHKDVLMDTKKVGMHLSINTTIDDTAYFSDFIIPDTTYVEGLTGVHSLYHYFFYNGIRNPIIEPMTDKTEDGRAMQQETFFIDVGQKLGSNLWGKGALKSSDGASFDLLNATDYQLKQIANLVVDIEKSGYKLDAKKEDVDFVEKNYPIAKFKNAVTAAEWPKVAFLLSRGGFFLNYDKHFENKEYKFPLNKTGMVRFFYEDLATRHNPISGKYMSGSPSYISLNEAGAYQGYNEDKVKAKYPFKLITYKSALHTQSRTMNLTWSLESEPENSVWINPMDAEAMNISAGEFVRLISPTTDDWSVTINGKKIDYKIKAYVTNRIKPGVLAVSCNFGHWCTTGQYKVPLEIKNPEKVMLGLARKEHFGEWKFEQLHGKKHKIADGDKILSDSRRDVGAPYVAVCQTAKLNNATDYPMMEYAGGGVAYFSGNVQIVKI